MIGSIAGSTNVNVKPVYREPIAIAETIDVSLDTNYSKDNLVNVNSSKNQNSIANSPINYPMPGMEVSLSGGLRYSDRADRILNNQRITKVGDIVTEGNYTINYMAACQRTDKGTYKKIAFTTNPSEEFIEKYSNIPDIKFSVHLVQPNGMGLGWFNYEDVYNIINSSDYQVSEGGKHL